MATEFTDITGIRRSFNSFDLHAPLTEEERLMLGDLRTHETARSAPMARIRDIEEDRRVPEDTVSVAGEGSNQEYVHWTRLQALVTLQSYQEGWSAFEDLVLKPFLEARRSENADYRGDDRDKAFSLRLREIAALEFVNYIRERFAEAAATPRPSE